MPVFKVNKPVNQLTALCQVDVTAAEPLPLGLNRFQLVVIDDAGNASAPITLDVIVRDTERPTAILEIVDGGGQAVDATVPFGKGFFLTGIKSKDTPPGKIKEYQFTLLERV
jgi:hypothetical protein